MRVTDGGLFENFGAVTADEVIRYIERAANRRPGSYKEIVAPIAILISSDPSLDLLDGVTNTGIVRELEVDPTSRAAALSGPGGRRPIATIARSVASAIGNDWPEMCPRRRARAAATILVDPALALYDGRVA